MKPLYKIAAAVVFSVLPYTAFASPDVNNTAWQFDIAPYAWGMSMDGRTQQGPFVAQVDENFSTLIKHFDGGGMLWIDVYKGPVGAFINGLYVDLSDHGEIDSFDVHVKSHFGLVTYGLSYIILQKDYKTQHIQLEPYAGGRYTFMNTTIAVEGIDTVDDQGWTDPIIGLRLRDDFSPRWVVTLAGDVGEGNPSKQYSYNLVGLLGYKPENKKFKNTTVYLGYRYLYEHYEHGKGLEFFEWNMRLFGPMLGINFNLE